MTTVEIIQPGPWLAINDRHHFAVRASRTKAWRHAAAVYALTQHAQPVTGRVQVHAVIHKPTRVRWDLDGAAATVKACVDGLRDAGVIPEDDSSIVARLVVEPGKVGKPGRVVVTITPLEDAAPVLRVRQAREYGAEPCFACGSTRWEHDCGDPDVIAGQTA